MDDSEFAKNLADVEGYATGIRRAERQRAAEKIKSAVLDTGDSISQQYDGPIDFCEAYRQLRQNMFSVAHDILKGTE
jgi:hypothetical protein